MYIITFLISMYRARFNEENVFSLNIMIFSKMCSPEGLAKALPEMVKSPNKMISSIVKRFYTFLQADSMQQKHPRCISTCPRNLLKVPWAGKYGLGSRHRKIGFRGLGPENSRIMFLIKCD